MIVKVKRNHQGDHYHRCDICESETNMIDCSEPADDCVDLLCNECTRNPNRLEE